MGYIEDSYRYLLYFCAWLIIIGCVTVLVVKENSSFTMERKREVELPDLNIDNSDFNIGNSTLIDSNNVDTMK